MSSHDDPFAEPEAHENHERYLITYADMITLLMALFIILFAIGQTDLEKYAKFAEGAHQAVGGSSSLLTGGGSVVDAAVGAAAHGTPSAATGADDGTVAEDSTDGVQTGEVVDATEVLATTIAALLQQRGLTESSVAAGSQGVVVTLPSEITFVSGSWSLLPQGHESLLAVAEALAKVRYDVIVNGHTDTTPMAAPLTNWELSTNRASTVVRELVALGVPNDRLAAAGYADTRPVADNASPAGRATNRRVEIVVVVPQTGSLDGAHGALHIGPPGVDVLEATAPTPASPKATGGGSGH